MTVNLIYDPTIELDDPCECVDKLITSECDLEGNVIQQPHCGICGKLVPFRFEKVVSN
jgi:hypothetical protein